MGCVYLYRKGELTADEAELPQEFPLHLTVNGREIASLMVSPHDLSFLVAGFLRLQGFVENLEEILVLSVCQESGIASVQVRKPLPDRLKPVLTSGCGAGISFSVPKTRQGDSMVTERGEGFSPEGILAAMEELAGRARGYKFHGGIHSAAIAGANGALLLFAEDIGRHNTVDRLAGEALFKGVETAGKMLVTSGRVSSEMAAKAVMLGVHVIASLTSPTDLALRICEDRGITLAGYVRGGAFTLYTHHERICAAAG